MLIAHRLVALSVVGAVALAAVGGVGVYGIHGISRQLDRLTGETLPIQSAVLEMRSGEERTLARLLALSHATGADDALALRESVGAELDALADTARRIEEHTGTTPFDIEAFRAALRDIGDTVDARLDGRAAFERAAADARAGLEDVASRVDDIGAGVGAIVDGANEDAALAQRRADALVSLQSGAHGVDSALGELAILLYAVDALSGKFRLPPLEERFVAATDAVRRILDDPATHVRLLDVVPDVDRLRAAFADPDAGLFASRLAVLDEGSGGRDAGARKAYRTARKTLSAWIETARRDVRTVIDDLELELVIERRSIADALALSGDPSSVVALTSRLLLGERTLGVRLEQLLRADTPARLERARAAAKGELDELSALTSRLGDGLGADDHAALIELAAAIESGVSAVGASFDRVADGLAAVIDGERALEGSLDGLASVADRQRESGRAYLERMSHEVADASREVDGEVWLATSLIVGLAAIAAAVSLLVSLLVTRSIIGRLHQALAVAESVSRGRLDPVPPSRSNDEVSRVLDAMGSMVAMLDGSVKKIRTATRRVNANAEEITEGNIALSERTERQAGHLGETAASTTRISEALREDASASGRASELVEGASRVAGRGRSAVRDAMESMEKVQGGAREISSITAVIDSLAFQTNILALNAAVEASRAGESGRGFSVVASEVRLLARKSKESAQQIREIIDGNVRDVETGTELVREAGRHIVDVATNVDEVTRLIADVSRSSHEQVESISRIDGSVGDLTRSTEDNAALSERIREAAVSMLEQSRSLDEAVSVFALDDDEATPVDARPAGPHEADPPPDRDDGEAGEPGRRAA